MNSLGLWLRVAVVALVAGLGIYVVTLRADVQRYQSDLALQTGKAESLRNTLRLGRELLSERDALDAKHTKELSDANSEIEQLRADVESGAKRLRVAATCKRMPADASAARVDDDRAAELSADARSAYFAHRQQVTTMRLQLLGLQEYVRAICLKPP